MNYVVDMAGTDLLTLIQGNIPVVGRPFALLGESIGMSESEMIEALSQLKSEKIIRQISAIFDSRSLGYQSSLVAARYDDARLSEAAAVINQHPGVSHNYQRNHDFNLWYTVAVSPRSQLGLEQTVACLHRASGALSTRLLPTLKLFKIGVKFDVSGESRPDDIDASGSTSQNNFSATELTSTEIEFVRLMQRDLPLTPAPFVDYARELGISLADLAAMHGTFLRTGRMRRFAAVLHHRRAGFSANAMGVWAVPGSDEEIERTGELMARFRAVSHCYRRPSYPDWPYNLFTMIHGKSESDCQQTLAAISAKTGIKQFGALYSTKEFKKVRVRYFTPEEAEWERTALERELLP